MAREVLYRRSFHSDRDLRGMVFDLDQELTGRKLLPDRRMSDGFEAPRNSLDIPSAGVDIRRGSEVRHEDIPFGYELSRSLTTRRKVEESRLKMEESRLKTTTAPEPHKEADHRRRGPSVVARLMGLEAMPQEACEPRKSTSVDKQSSNQSSRRHFQEVLPQLDGKAASKQGDGRALSKQGDLSAARSLRDMPSQWFNADSDTGRKPSEALSFREHPQEKQLQDFKREFAARQAVQSGDSSTQEWQTKSVGKQQAPGSGHAAQDETKHAQSHEQTNPKEFGASDNFNESKEFLDALQFLHTNRNFFLKVLQDPNSLVARQLQHFRTPSKQPPRAKPDSHPKAGKTAKNLSESRKEGLNLVQAYAGEFAESRRRQELNQQERKQCGGSKLLPDWQSSQRSKFRADEEMPMRKQRQSRPFYSIGTEPKQGTGCEQQLPTRIVILKPSQEKCLGTKPATKMSCSPRELDVNFKMLREEGKENNTKAIVRDAKERIRQGSTGKKVEVRANNNNKEMARSGQSRGGLMKDPREIAKEIVQKVRENVSRKLASDQRTYANWEASSSSRSSSSKRAGLPPKRGGAAAGGGDLCGVSDGEGPYMRSRSGGGGGGGASRDHSRSCFSLPSSPRLANKLLPEPPSHEDRRSTIGLISMRQAMAEEQKSKRGAQLIEDGRGLGCSPRSARVFAPSSRESSSIDMRVLSDQGARLSFNGGIMSNSNRMIINTTNNNGFIINNNSNRFIVSNSSSNGESATVAGRRSSYGEGRSSSSSSNSCAAEVELKMNSPRVLARSRSVPGTIPAEASGGVAAMEEDGQQEQSRRRGGQEEEGDDERDENLRSLRGRASSSTVRGGGGGEGGGLKGKMMSLKDSLSLGGGTTTRRRKKSVRKMVGVEEDGSGTAAATPSYSKEEEEEEEDDEDEEEGFCEENDNNKSTFDGSCGIEMKKMMKKKKKKKGQHPASPPLHQQLPPDTALWSSTADAVDSASETSIDKCEQPSPISVLETPFLEESPSPVDLQEHDSSIRELRLKLSLLQLEHKKPDSKSRILHGLETTCPDFRLTQNELDFEAKDELWCLRNSSPQPKRSTIPDLLSPTGREADLSYIRDILAVSGFSQDRAALVSSSSADHGLNPCVFQKLERYYHQKGLGNASVSAKSAGMSLDALDRRLLFDIVDEILLERLAMPAAVNSHPWMKPPKPSICFVRTGKQLLDCIWAEIKSYSSSHPDCEEDILVEDVAAKDLCKAGSWPQSESDMEAIALDMEQQILDALIEETVYDLRPKCVAL